MKRWLILLLLWMFPVCSLADEVSLDISWNGEIRGYSSCPLTITSDAAGQVTLVIGDGQNNWLKQTFNVAAGETVIPWMGLGDCDERIPDGQYFLTATLSYEGGTAQCSGKITFSRCMNAVVFALPSSDTIYPDEDNDWFAEVCIVRSGTVYMDVIRADTPGTVLYTRKSAVSSADPKKLYWNGHDGSGNPLPPGAYFLRFYESKTPGWIKEISVTIAQGKRPDLPLQITGAYLPDADADDAEIWTLMQKPSAVVDIRYVAHQNVYAQPDQNSDVLGTLHGQSQTVDVKEIRQDGWVLIGAWNHECGEYVEGYVPENRLKMVEPNREYGLLLDKIQQRMALFHRGQRVAEIDVSTGLVAESKLFRETPAGSYLTVEHMDDFSMDGKKYQYVIRYDGGNLIHQIPYKPNGRYKDFTKATEQLGSKASHGCIRVPREKGDIGINAYWLWTNLPWHTRLIILDDPLQRKTQAAAVQGGRDPLTAGAWYTPEEPAALDQNDQELILTLGGDLVLGTRENWWNKPEGLPAYLERNGADYFLNGLQKLFATDDMTFINLECVLKDSKRGEDTEKEYRFRGLASYTSVLREGSVEQVNIANNHYIDYGSEGKESTRAALETAGIPYSGFEYTYVWEKDGWKVGFAGCRETVYKRDKDVIRRDVEALKAASCDVIIYSCHWGEEYSAGHNQLQEEMARVCADLGVNIVVGTHPHVVQGVSTVDDTVVIWSLGNLMFGGTHEMATFDAALARVKLRFNKQGYTGCTVQMIPILTSTSADIGLNDFRPVIAKGANKERIWMKIQADSGVVLLDEMYFPAQR